MSESIYKRVLLKLGGESLVAEEGDFGLDQNALKNITEEIRAAKDLGVEIAIVIGGGNILRGASLSSIGIERTTGDYMGMLATVINALALQAALEQAGIATRVQTAIEIQAVAEAYVRRRAVRHLEKGRVVIFAGGTGNPYFSTDTAAALRAIEINADVIIKGTKVDGIYSDDPENNPDAIKYDSISFKEVIEKELRVMDLTAITLCKENNLPIVVFDISKKDSLFNIFNNHKEGTIISNGDIKW